MFPSPLSLEDQGEDEMLKRAIAMSLEEEEVAKEELCSITEEEMLKKAIAMSLVEQ